MSAWSLVTYRTREGESRAGALTGDRVVELPVKARGVLDLVQRWEEVEPVLRKFDPTSASTAWETPAASVKLIFGITVACLRG